MKILGIVAEYNPFHNGHLYHIEKSKEITGADAVIAVMSGNFVQRGEPAIVDKYARAEMAVRNGVDVVFELPFCYAVNSADNFAKGSIRLLDSLGCVDYLSFGSESGSIEEIDKVADFLAIETDEFKEALKEGLDKGDSYPKARFNALLRINKRNPELLKGSNNILGIEYLRYLKMCGSGIKPVTIKREGQGYNESVYCADDYKFASATAIREMIHGNVENSILDEVIPPSVCDVLADINSDVKVKLNDIFDNLRYKIISSSTDELAEIFAVTEGMENRLISAARFTNDIDSLIEESISKRYTGTRVRRMLVQTLVGLKRKDFNFVDEEKAMYGRILGFSEKGAGIIKNIKNSDGCRIPIITNINKEILESDAQNMLLRYDLKATDIYNLIAGRSIYAYSDNVRRPYMEGHSFK